MQRRLDQWSTALTVMVLVAALLACKKRTPAGSAPSAEPVAAAATPSAAPLAPPAAAAPTNDASPKLGEVKRYADKEKTQSGAVRILENAKTQRLGTCNTAESLLVARSIAKTALPKLAEMLLSKGVEIRGCEETRAIVPQAKAATEEDYYTEYLDSIISCKVVSGLDEAIEHINKYSSQHTEAIVTENYTKARQFLREVDSSSVMVNASTRFADGFEYGFGAEIGISTDKLHARGPVGLEGLTSLKYVVLGDGHVRA